MGGRDEAEAELCAWGPVPRGSSVRQTHEIQTMNLHLLPFPLFPGELPELPKKQCMGYKPSESLNISNYFYSLFTVGHLFPGRYILGLKLLPLEIERHRSVIF